MTDLHTGRQIKQQNVNVHLQISFFYNFIIKICYQFGYENCENYAQGCILSYFMINLAYFNNSKNTAKNSIVVQILYYL